MTSYPEQLVFGLDIGTRSIVGTVGYQTKDRFYVVAQKAREHETRAMLDGQIHDIGKVAGTIRQVKEALEDELGQPLKDVSIAAAGRVLKTITVRVDEEMDAEREVSEEDVYALSTKGVELAYESFQQENKAEALQFYCVGYSVVRYYMNDYPMGNLVGHKARAIGADLIATFLPDDVVDGLYKAVELSGLQVVNMTLEPIAAIGVAIPEMYRMLNIALVDVGAGTSDISITKDGAITAFGMIPMAGDSLTEAIARHCLVDFTSAEKIKRAVETEEMVTYTDIMGLPQTISREEVLAVAEPALNQMAKYVADKIKELNGDKPVSAVFVVGGGGKLAGYTEKLAEYLGIAKERVAVRGEQVMQSIEFVKTDLEINSLLVTPIGICLSFYEQNNNFIYVTFNEKRVKLYDNSNLAVIDAAMQAQFDNRDLFPKRGEALQYTVNGSARQSRGTQGESAKIYINGKVADIHSKIKGNDQIVVIPSTKGEDAKREISSLPEYGSTMEFVVQGQKISVPKFVMVNGKLESAYYEIKQNDQIEFVNYYSVEQLLQFMDVELPPTTQFYVNHYKANSDTPVYENFTVEWDENAAASADTYDALPEAEPGLEGVCEGMNDQTFANPGNDGSVKQESEEEESKSPERPKLPYPIHVVVNSEVITMNGKSEYVFVDVFDYINFDLKRSQGRAVVTLLNGRQAQYLEPLHEGDKIQIYWQEK